MTGLFFRRYSHKRVIVNTKTGKTFKGILWAVRGPLVILRQAEIFESAHALPVDGELLIERSNLDFLQVLTDADPSI
jgi:hypothetical protein